MSVRRQLLLLTALAAALQSGAVLAQGTASTGATTTATTKQGKQATAGKKAATGKKATAKKTATGKKATKGKQATVEKPSVKSKPSTVAKAVAVEKPVPEIKPLIPAKLTAATTLSPVPAVVPVIAGSTAAAKAAASGTASAPAAARQGPLAAAYVKARQADPLFRGALAERDTNLVSSKVSGVAYYPQINVGTSQLENEGGASRRSLSVIQPVFAIDRYATMQEEEPRRRLAEAAFLLQASELAKRVYQTTANLIRARESHALNSVRIKTVEQHKRAAKRAYDLGQGTLTDLRDAEVKAYQATAEDHRLRAAVAAAERDYVSIVGESPADLRLANLKTTSIDTVGADAASRNNPALAVAREQERIGELAVMKARSAWLPNVNASVTVTELNGKKDTLVGLSLNMPLQAGGVIGTASAGSRLTKLREDTNDAERRIKLDTQRMYEAVQAGLAEVEGRRSAIDAAQLSVAANEKSLKGGVRSMTDLLTSIETLYQLKNEHIQTILALGESLLQLRLHEGIDPLDSLQEVDTLILH